MKMQKTKLRHRVLALALALMLCVSMLNLTAFAAEGDEVVSEQPSAPVGEVTSNPDKDDVLNEDETSDQDGILNEDEASDENGILNEDEASDENGILNGDETSDGDGILNEDETSDGDGILNEDETSDQDGILNEDETSDQDGILNEDETSDEDEILDATNGPVSAPFVVRPKDPKNPDDAANYLYVYVNMKQITVTVNEPSFVIPDEVKRNEIAGLKTAADAAVEEYNAKVQTVLEKLEALNTAKVAVDEAYKTATDAIKDLKVPTAPTTADEAAWNQYNKEFAQYCEDYNAIKAEYDAKATAYSNALTAFNDVYNKEDITSLYTKAQNAVQAYNDAVAEAEQAYNDSVKEYNNAVIDANSQHLRNDATSQTVRAAGEALRNATDEDYADKLTAYQTAIANFNDAAANNLQKIVQLDPFLPTTPNNATSSDGKDGWYTLGAIDLGDNNPFVDPLNVKGAEKPNDPGKFFDINTGNWYRWDVTENGLANGTSEVATGDLAGKGLPFTSEDAAKTAIWNGLTAMFGENNTGRFDGKNGSTSGEKLITQDSFSTVTITNSNGANHYISTSSGADKVPTRHLDCTMYIATLSSSGLAGLANAAKLVGPGKLADITAPGELDHQFDGPGTPSTQKYQVSYYWEGLPDGHNETLPTGGTYTEGDAVPVDTDYTKGTEVVIDGATYTFSGWDRDDFKMPAENVTITGEWTKTAVPPTPVEPKVARYVVQWLVKDSGKLLHSEIRGPEAIGTDVTVTEEDKAKTFEDYQFLADETKDFSGTLTKDSLVILKLYYATKPAPEYKVTYDWSGLPENHGQTLPTEPDHKANDSVNVNAEYTNGTEVAIAGKTYVFSGWSTTDATVEDGKFTMPAQDVTITGTWTEKTPEETSNPTPPTTPTNPTTHNLTVNKLWVGDEGTDARPDSIQVQLYLSGAAYGSPVTLSAANGWSYTWIGLPTMGTPTVEELNIPEGYEAATSISGSNVTITNTYTDEEIKDPDVPLGPGPGEPTPTPTPAPSEKPTPGPSATPDPDEDIEDPDVPLGPGPEDPDDPDEEIPDENVPLGTPKPVEPSEPDDGEEIPDEEVPMANTPKTGDDSGVWMTLALISAAGLVFLGISRRKKGENVR